MLPQIQHPSQTIMRSPQIAQQQIQQTQQKEQQKQPLQNQRPVEQKQVVGAQNPQPPPQQQRQDIGQQVRRNVENVTIINESVNTMRDIVSKKDDPKPSKTEAKSSLVHNDDAGKHVKREEMVDRRGDGASASGTARASGQSHSAQASKKKEASDKAVQPLTSERRPPDPSQPNGTGDGQTQQKRQLKVEDALAYLEKVKVQFTDQLNVYNKFLDIMKEFKAQEIDTTEVIRRVSDLFAGHKELMLGFNTFLPPGYEIRVTENEATGVLNTGFMGPEGFSELPPYRGAIAKPSNFRSVSKKPTSATSPKRRDGRAKASSRLSNPAQASASAAGNHMDIDIPGGQAVLSRGGPGGRVESAHRRNGRALESLASGGPMPRITSLPNGGGSVDSQERSYEFERAIGFIHTVKNRFQNNPQVFRSFLETLDRFRSEQKSINEVFKAVADIFGSHKDLLQTFKEFLPAIAVGGFADDRIGRRATTIGNQRRTSGSRAQSLGTPTRRGPGGARCRRRLQDMQFFEDLKETLGVDKVDLYLDFIKCLRLFNERIVNREELEAIVSGLFEAFPAANAIFLQYIDAAFGSGDEGGDDGSSSTSSDIAGAPIDEARRFKYLRKPVSETGAEHNIAQEGSYRLLPPDFPVFLYSGRSALERKTLNDHWVSGTSGSEDYSFKFMRKNQFEDNLFRCEDDRYELDMLIETTKSTVTRLESVHSSVSRLTSADKRRHHLANGALSQVHFSTIQRIYGQTYGPALINQLKLDPSRTIPVIVKRLRIKLNHWIKTRQEMNRVWREVGERNYHRSLDHRSNIFKQADKKDLSAKSLVQDVLDPESSMNTRETEVARARGYTIPSGAGGANDRSGAIKAVMKAAKRAKRAPHLTKTLELRFEELEVHAVVFKLVKGRIMEEFNNKGQGVRLVERLKRFLQLFLDVEFTKDGKCIRAFHSTVQEGKCAFVFSDEWVFLTMRMYHILFERILTALNLSRERIKEKENREKQNKIGMARMLETGLIPKLATKPSMLTKPFSSDGSKDHLFLLGPSSDSSKELFSDFMESLGLFIRSKMDSPKFEEKCRVLLGPGSYCLFTLDKTVSKFVKNAVASFGDEGKWAAKDVREMYQKYADKVARSRNAGGGLVMKDLERVYLSAIVDHVHRIRGGHVDIFKMQCVYEESKACSVFVIEAVGKCDSLQARLCNSKHDTLLSECIGKVIDGRKAYESVKQRKDEQDHGKKRKRDLNVEFVKFAGSSEARLKRARVLDISMHNGLIWKPNKKGRLAAKPGTIDYFVNRARKDSFWSKERDATEENKKCPMAQIVRNRFAKSQTEAAMEDRESGDEDKMEVDAQDREVKKVEESNVVEKECMEVDKAKREENEEEKK